MYRPSITTLNNVSVDLEKFSNIGEIGLGVSYADNQIATEMQNEFPLLNWLRQTSVSRKWQSALSNGSLQIRKHSDDGLFYVTKPFTWGTTAPTDMSDECCWIPLELAKCGDEVPIYMVCLKDCNPLLENLIYNDKRFQSNDLITDFTRQGETVKQARTRMAQLSMAWFSAHNFILGTTTTATSTLKPFHGLLEVMEGADVLHMVGTNLLASFDSLACRLAVIGEGTDVKLACHPLVYEAVKATVTPGQFGQLPTGWTKDANGDVQFHGHSFIVDKMLPVDTKEGTGEIWMVDGGTTGIVTGTDLIPSENFIREQFATNSNRNDGCATECTFYYNYGTVGNTNPNKLAVITDVKLGANCLGSATSGLDYLINPETIAPINN